MKNEFTGCGPFLHDDPRDQGGCALDGAFYQPESGASKGAVLIMHGNCGNFYTGLPRNFAPLLVRLGYAVLAFNRPRRIRSGKTKC